MSILRTRDITSATLYVMPHCLPVVCVRLRRVFCTQHRIKSDGRYKSRVVACGNRQARDELDLYSPTPRLSTVRVLLHQAVNNNWAADVSDVSVAFLNSRLPKPIYCHLPAGRQKPGEKKQVMRCQKALYGIHPLPTLTPTCFVSSTRMMTAQP